MPLAASANGHVFDLDEPTPDEVDAFWADVETARRRIRGEQGFWQKVRGDVSLRTFRDHLPDGAGLGAGAATHVAQPGVVVAPGHAAAGRPTKAGIGTTAPTAQRRRRGQKGEP